MIFHITQSGQYCFTYKGRERFKTPNSRHSCPPGLRNPHFRNVIHATILFSQRPSYPADAFQVLALEANPYPPATSVY